jgi:hypothetical protein
VKELLSVSAKNRFFPEICIQAIVDLLRWLAKPAFTSLVVPLLAPLLSRDPSEFTPETVFLWAKISQLFSVSGLSEFLTLQFDISQHSSHFTKNLYTIGNLHKVATALRVFLGYHLPLTNSRHPLTQYHESTLSGTLYLTPV